MTNRYWGTIYLVQRDWRRLPDNKNDSKVVYSFDDARSHMQVAIELWQLAGDNLRATRIAEMMDRAYASQPHLLREADIDELLELIDGLEQRLIGTVVFERWHVRTEQLPELRRRTTMLDFDERPGAVPEAGVAEGMSRVAVLREILQRAQDEKLDVLMD